MVQLNVSVMFFNLCLNHVSGLSIVHFPTLTGNAMSLQLELSETRFAFRNFFKQSESFRKLRVLWIVLCLRM
jgi:hypothetical protein